MLSPSLTAAAGPLVVDLRYEVESPESPPNANRHMIGPRLLGVDVGDRRVGVAISDAMGLTAQPVMILVRSNRREDA